MLQMVEYERSKRSELVEGGVRNAEREAFELLPEVGFLGAELLYVTT